MNRRAHREHHRNPRWQSVPLPILLAGALLVGTRATAAPTDVVLYGVTPHTCDCLFTIDLTTGVSTEIGPLGAPGDIVTVTSMAIDLDGTIYAVDNHDDVLITIDPKTGAATDIGSGVGSACGAIAINPTPVPGPSGMFPAGTIFATRMVPSKIYDELITIDKFTGFPTVVGSLSRTYAGLDFRSDGTLFAAELKLGPEVLATIDTATGAETIIGTMDVDIVGALVFDPYDTLLMSASGPIRIWEVDTSTAELSNPLDLATDCCVWPKGLGFLKTPPISVESASWGRVKGAYRGR